MVFVFLFHSLYLKLSQNMSQATSIKANKRHQYTETDHGISAAEIIFPRGKRSNEEKSEAGTEEGGSKRRRFSKDDGPLNLKLTTTKDSQDPWARISELEREIQKMKTSGQQKESLIVRTLAYQTGKICCAKVDYL